MFAAVEANGRLMLWDIGDPRTRPALLTENDSGEARVDRLTFSPDGRILAAVGWSRTAALWDVTDRSAPRRLAGPKGHAGAVRSVAFAPDGRTVATGGSEGSTILWDIADRTRVRRLATLSGTGSAVRAVAFDPDRRLVATGDALGAVAVWDISDLTTPVRFAQTAALPYRQASQLVFSPDRRTLAVGFEASSPKPARPSCCGTTRG